MRPTEELLKRLEVAREAVVTQDLSRMLKSQQALTDHHHNRLLGVPVPEDDVIHLGDVNNATTHTQAPQKGLSPLIGGLIGAGLMATGIGGFFGLGMVADAIKAIKPGSTVVQPVTPGDGNTKYNLELLP